MILQLRFRRLTSQSRRRPPTSSTKVRVHNFHPTFQRPLFRRTIGSCPANNADSSKRYAIWLMTAPFSHLPADGADEGVDIFKLSIFRVPFHFTASWRVLHQQLLPSTRLAVDGHERVACSALSSAAMHRNIFALILQRASGQQPCAPLLASSRAFSLFRSQITVLCEPHPAISTDVFLSMTRSVWGALDPYMHSTTDCDRGGPRAGGRPLQRGSPDHVRHGASPNNRHLLAAAAAAAVACGLWMERRVFAQPHTRMHIARGGHPIAPMCPPKPSLLGEMRVTCTAL